VKKKTLGKPRRHVGKEKRLLVVEAQSSGLDIGEKKGKLRSCSHEETLGEGGGKCKGSTTEKETKKHPHGRLKGESIHYTGNENMSHIRGIEVSSGRGVNCEIMQLKAPIVRGNLGPSPNGRLS